MTLSNEVVTKFNEAKSGNYDAINYFVIYFMGNVEKQLQNLDLSPEEKAERRNKCHSIILRNIHICYDSHNYVEQTLNDIKNAIYLNQITEPDGSKNIVIVQKDIIRAKLSTSNLDFVNISVKDRELARLFYLENKSVDALAEMYKCSKTIIYVRLRRVANALSAQKTSNFVPASQPFFTGSRK